jgi:hypothetical protein
MTASLKRISSTQYYPEESPLKKPRITQETSDSYPSDIDEEMSETNSKYDSESSSEEFGTLTDFFNEIQQLDNLQKNFTKRIEKLWSDFDEIPKCESEKLEGRCRWIVESDEIQKIDRSLLIRIYKGEGSFNSTSISEKALSKADQKKQWYKVEVVEYIYDNFREEGGFLRDSHDEFLVDMRLGPIGGIDWIRKGITFNGSTAKDIAMKLGKYLCVPKLTLFDDSRFSSRLDNSKYSMRVIFSLTEGSSWYERDGFVAMNCKGILDDNGNLDDTDSKIYQDNVAYYAALKNIREIKINDLYRKIITPTEPKRRLLQAYRLFSEKKVTENDLLKDNQTDFSKLLTYLWKNNTTTKCKENFNYIYTEILNKPIKLFKDSTDKEVQWNTDIDIISKTKYFIKRFKNQDSQKLIQLASNLNNPKSKTELRKLGSLY